MGVRFECPNGHKLNIKIELVGKRGICPECQARFIVPAEGGVRVAAVETQPQASPAPLPAPARPEPATAALASPSALPREVDGPPDVGAMPTAAGPTSAEAVLWYVRPPGGGQFGPASTEAFQQWIAQGRVTADSWVWRTGWADWKPGSESLPKAADWPAPPAVHPPPAIPATSPASTPSPAAPVEVATAEARRAEIRRRKKRIQSISITLALVAAALVIVMILVLSR